MPLSKTGPFQNHLLAALPQAVLESISHHFTPVSLPRRTQLEQPDRKIKHVYFLESGICSIVAARSPGIQVEVGIIGKEGMTGLPLVRLNDRSPYSAFMQVEGAAQRIEADMVLGAMERDPECRRVFLGFAQGFFVQVAETAVANAKADVGQRLARWLLMVQDRVGGKDIPLTHEFLSLMMGVRRPGVTGAVQALKRDGLVDGERGKIIIADRVGLEARAGSFYGVPERELERLLAQTVAPIPA